MPEAFVIQQVESGLQSPATRTYLARLSEWAAANPKLAAFLKLIGITAFVKVGPGVGASLWRSFRKVIGRPALADDRVLIVSELARIQKESEALRAILPRTDQVEAWIVKKNLDNDYLKGLLCELDMGPTMPVAPAAPAAAPAAPAPAEQHPAGMRGEDLRA